jgi:predicted nucleic acid-binding protein
VKYLLDADWVIDFLAGRSEAVSLIAALAPEGIAVSSITLSEVIHGVIGSRDPQSAALVLQRFLTATPVLDFTKTTAERAAAIRIDLRRNKRQIHERALDILAAATAMEHDLVMVTRNLDHFQDITGLRLYRGSSVWGKSCWRRPWQATKASPAPPCRTTATTRHDAVWRPSPDTP